MDEDPQVFLGHLAPHFNPLNRLDDTSLKNDTIFFDIAITALISHRLDVYPRLDCFVAPLIRRVTPRQTYQHTDVVNIAHIRTCLDVDQSRPIASRNHPVPKRIGWSLAPRQLPLLTQACTLESS